MKRDDFLFIAVPLLLIFQFGNAQRSVMMKTLDTSCSPIVAILRIDTSGARWFGSTGVLIHPKVVLTTGHVNYNEMKKRPGGCREQGFVTFDNDMHYPKNLISFNWSQDIELYSDTLENNTLLSDGSNAIGLLFLHHSINNISPVQLPTPKLLTKTDSKYSFTTIGFPYADGLRHRWRFNVPYHLSEQWLSTECDSILRISDNNGAPLIVNDNTVVAIWSRLDITNSPCPYSSWAARMDNPKLLAWIKKLVKERIDVEIR